VKINQYCSVCKKHLDMEVIPTDDDGGDDGVIWLRCPDCQGFLPKFSGEGLKSEPPATTDAATSAPTVAEPADSAPIDSSPVDSAPADSAPVDHPAAVSETTAPTESPAATDAGTRDAKKPEPPAEPVAEYAALLAAADPENARPYRPSSEYAVGDVVHHLAYDDIGIVVAKESLPGGRQAVKVYFEEAGVVHLIEKAADGR